MICSGGDSLDDLGLPCFGNDGGGAISHQGCTGSLVNSWVDEASNFGKMMKKPSKSGFSSLQRF